LGGYAACRRKTRRGCVRLRLRRNRRRYARLRSRSGEGPVVEAFAEQAEDGRHGIDLFDRRVLRGACRLADDAVGNIRGKNRRLAGAFRARPRSETRGIGGISVLFRRGASKPRLAAVVKKLPERERLRRFGARAAGDFACTRGNHVAVERPGGEIVVAAPEEHNRVLGFSQHRNKARPDERGFPVAGNAIEDGERSAANAICQLAHFGVASVKIIAINLGERRKAPARDAPA
jgi:hypothetical protein